MAVIATSRPVTRGVQAALDAAGIRNGVGSRQGLALPCTVLYPAPPGLGGPLGDRFADGEHTVFLHHVGVGAEQVERQADLAAAALLGSDITVEGRTVMQVRRETAQPVQRDDNVDPPLFYAVDQYVLSTTT